MKLLHRIRCRFIQLCQRRHIPHVAAQAFEESRELCAPYTDRVYGHMIQMCAL